jgi:tyrosinase
VASLVNLVFFKSSSRTINHNTDWNWFLDMPDGGGSFLQSPIFDPVSGFGGNGQKVNPPGSSPYPVSQTSKGGGCVPDGFLSTHLIRIGPYGKMSLNNTRCLRRDLNPASAINASKKVISKIFDSKNYAQFCTRLGALHSVGHGGVGGEVSIPILRSTNFLTASR